MKKIGLAILVFFLIGLSAQAQNVGGIWLSGPGIVGDGTGVHNGETQVISLQDSVINTMDLSTGARAGKLVIGNIRFKKSVNANSVSLFASISRATILPNLAFKFYERKQNGSIAPVLTITVSNVIVTMYKIELPDSNSSQAAEEISLLFDKIQLLDSTGNSAVAGRSF